MADAKIIALVGASILLTSGLFFGGKLLTRQQAEKPISIVVPTLSEEAKNGAISFGMHCVQCHGPDASGTDRGPSLIHRIYESRHHADFSFVRAVTLGVSQHHWLFGSMPPQAQVSRQEIDRIIIYIRELQRANGIQ